MKISHRVRVSGVKSDTPAYKKKEKSDSGGTIYRYDEPHIEKRQKLKEDKLKKLEKEIEKVRTHYRKDLKSDDERTRAIAAIIGIMEESGMRVGNVPSAQEGTYGATTLKVKHVKGGSGNMTFDFPGKGNIEQNIVIKNNEVIKVIRDLMKGKKSNDFIFEVDGKKIWDRTINRYLSPLGISAKDLRGFRANKLMQDMLKKKDFEEALEEVADIVGHDPATLKNQYLSNKLVEKHEKKENKEKKAAISIRAENIFDDTKVGPGTMPHPEDITKEPAAVEVSPETLVNLNKNVGNVEGDIANYPKLQRAWQILAPFLPEGARITSGWRSDNEQAKIIIDYWLSAVWANRGKRETWKRDQGFFYTNFPGPRSNVLRWWRGKAVSGVPISGRLYKKLKRDIEPLRKIMTSYKPTGVMNEPPVALSIAALGTSKHLQGLAFDVGGAPIKTIERATNYINKNVAPIFSRILPEKGQNVVHVVIQPSVSLDDKTLTNALLEYQSLYSKRASVSKRAMDPDVERYVSQLEGKYFGTADGQPIAQRQPDNNFREGLSIKPGVKLNNVILSAWATLRPFLPKGAVMTSGARTSQDQIRIINNYWAKSGLEKKYPDVKDPHERSKMLIENKWIVGPPTTTKKNVHLTGRAFDISGADLDDIANAARKVSQDTSIPVSFSQILIERNNNAVHVGIRDAVWNPGAVEKALRASNEIFLFKTAENAETTELSSIYEDLLASNPPEDVLKEHQEILGDVMTEPNKGSPEASSMLSSRAFDDYEEFKREMGMGLADEPGDWFEKSPIFRHREEEDIPEYSDTKASKSEASKLASDNPDKFFYRGLHKEFPQFEAKALENFIKENAVFYFNFKYHEREEPEFKKLLEPAAEALAQQDVRAFFYYHLHHNMPELGRGAIIQLIDTNPDSFFDLGLQKDYPDYEEAAGHARNIKDPNKVELEMPEWLNNDVDKPMSLRDRNAAWEGTRKLTVFPEKTEDGPDETQPGMVKFPSMEELQKMQEERDKQLEKTLAEEPDYEQRPMDISFDQEVDMRYMKPPDVVRYFLFKHYKRDRYSPHNKEILLKLFVVQPSKFFDLGLFNDPEFVEDTRRAVFHVAMLEPEYFKRFVEPNFPELSEGYRSLADKSMADGRDDAQRRSELLKQKLSTRELVLSKRAADILSFEAGGLDPKIVDDVNKLPGANELPAVRLERGKPRFGKSGRLILQNNPYIAIEWHLGHQPELAKTLDKEYKFLLGVYLIFEAYSEGLMFEKCLRSEYLTDNYRATIMEEWGNGADMFDKLDRFLNSATLKEQMITIRDKWVSKAEQDWQASISKMEQQRENVIQFPTSNRELKRNQQNEEYTEQDSIVELFPKESSFTMPLSKRAGKLDYPQKMLDDIAAWVEEVAPKFKWKLFGEPTEKLTKVFSIDIGDTEQYEKHLWLPEARKLITDADWDTELKVTLYRSDPYEGEDRKTGGTYGHEEGHHEIWVFDILNELKSGELEDTLKHELTHMMQVIMTTLVQTAERGRFEGHAGMPTHKEPEHELSHRTEELGDSEQSMRQYQRQDIEFAPFLQETISKMQNYVGSVASEERKERFLEFVGRDKFIAGLKDYDTTRYNKALRELYRAFENMP